jgi:hypothetical protein
VFINKEGTPQICSQLTRIQNQTILKIKDL